MVKHVRCFNVDCQTPTFLLSVCFLNFPRSGPQKPLIESISHFVCRTPPPQDEQTGKNSLDRTSRFTMSTRDVIVSEFRIGLVFICRLLIQKAYHLLTIIGLSN